MTLRYDDVRGWSDRSLARGHLGACEGRRTARVALYEAAIRERGGDPVPWTLTNLGWPTDLRPEARRVLLVARIVEAAERASETYTFRRLDES